jgi:type III restriction enzyme
MGAGSAPKAPLVVEVDTENESKDLDKLDMEIPVLTPRVYREYKNLADLDIRTFGNQRVHYRQFSDEEQREIIFRDVTTGEISHTTIFDAAGVADYRSVIGYFSQTIMKNLRLVSGYDILYGKVKAFVQEQLFDRPIDLESRNTLRNLSELEATKAVIDSFQKAVNALTVRQRGDAEIRDTIKLRRTRPFVVKEQQYLVPQKSVFNRIIGDGGLELDFAAKLEAWSDVESFSKNYLAVGFRLDYVRENGDISSYVPDFFVKTASGRMVIVETKGREELDLPQKMARLRQWCEDVNRVEGSDRFDFVYVEEESFEKYQVRSFEELIKAFRQYKD